MSETPIPADAQRHPEGDELAGWMNAWQDPGQGSGAIAADDLAARIERVKRGSRRFGIGLIALTIGEVLFSLAVIVGLGYWAWLKPDLWRWTLLLLGAVLVVTAQAFTLMNRRGTYRPKNQTTQAFVELEWLRAQRQLRTIRFSLRFFLVEIAAIAGLRVAELASRTESLAPRLADLGVTLASVTLGLLVVLGPAFWLWHRWIRRKMAELEPLRDAFRRSPEE